MNKIFLLLKISRPVNVLISFLTIIIAAELSGGLDPIENVILAALCAALITIGANVINDYYDIEIDKINKPHRPHRPLAAGTLSKKTVFFYFISVYILAWFLVSYINVWMLLIAVTTSIVLYLYSFYLKRTILWGNITVSFATAMAFIFGGFSVGHYKEAIFPAAFAFLFHLGREILKDIQDMDGDRRAGAITFPVKYGISSSIDLIFVDFILLVFLTAIPYILSIYSIRYFLTICFGIYPVLFFVLYRSRKDISPENLGFLSNLLKADMLIGLLAIYLK
jgi:geranylgeranylglycerol-phosphate geranylgeranyltransferase